MEPLELLLHVVRPALAHINMRGTTAELLVLTTAFVESGGREIDQTVGSASSDTILGPGIGLWQVERATADSLWDHFLKYRPALRDAMNGMLAPWPNRTAQLATNLCYGAAMCRLKYRTSPDPLPPAPATLQEACSPQYVQALGRYWKAGYNTLLGPHPASWAEPRIAAALARLPASAVT